MPTDQPMDHAKGDWVAPRKAHYYARGTTPQGHYHAGNYALSPRLRARCHAAYTGELETEPHEAIRLESIRRRKELERR